MARELKVQSGCVPKQAKRALFIVPVLLAGAVAWWAAADREPIYQGRSLSQWLESYPVIPVMYGDGDSPRYVTFVFGLNFPFFPVPDESDAEQRAAHDAVRHIGTDAVPTLLRMLRARDSVLKGKAMDLLDRQSLIQIRWTKAEELNKRAVWAFYALSNKAEGCVTKVVEIANQNISPESQACSVQALGFIGPGAKAAIPSLLKWASDADSYDTRRCAIQVLLRLHAEPDQVVPLLTNALMDKYLQGLAVEGLQEYGPDARAAVPVLMDHTNRTRFGISQYYAIVTLGCIGPSAEEAVPWLLGWATNTNTPEGYGGEAMAAIEALGKIRAQPDRVLPVLVRMLHDDEGLERYAAEALGTFGPAAKPAVPALIELLNHTRNAMTRSSAVVAIKRIDPETIVEPAGGGSNL
jgi:HEAT repeat protein